MIDIRKKYLKSKAKSKNNITRGFKAVEDSLKKKSRYVKSCNNCHFYYAQKFEKEEYCQNDQVTQYDIVIEGSTCFCCYWKPPYKENKKEPKETNDYLARFKKELRK